MLYNYIDDQIIQRIFVDDIEEIADDVLNAIISMKSTETIGILSSKAVILNILDLIVLDNEILNYEYDLLNEYDYDENIYIKLLKSGEIIVNKNIIFNNKLTYVDSLIDRDIILKKSNLTYPVLIFEQ